MHSKLRCPVRKIHDLVNRAYIRAAKFLVRASADSIRGPVRLSSPVSFIDVTRRRS